MELKVGEMVLLRNAGDEEWQELRLVFQARGCYYAFAELGDDILTDYLMGGAITKQIPLSEDRWPRTYTIIRLKNGEGGFRVVMGSHSLGVIVTGSSIPYERLLELYEMSRNSGVSWEPCGIEVKA